MRPTREMRPRPILSFGLGGTLIGSDPDTGDPLHQYVQVIEGGRDTVFPHEDLGATANIDPTDGNVHTGTLDADCTITLLPPDAARADAVSTLEVYLTEDETGGWTPTFAASGGTIVWPGGSAPDHDTTAETVTRYVFESVDDGTIWYGNVVGAGGGASALDDLTDVTITTPAENDTLRYIGGEWVNDNRRWEPVTFNFGSGPELVWDGDDLVMEWKEY